MSKLYGRIVESSSRMTLSEQVYCILCEEIHAGRWRIGERLPGASNLSQISGLSRAPIQQAFEKLESEGWVQQKPRSGTYLTAVLPYGHQALGAIGIVICQGGRSDEDPTISFHLHAILKIAAERNFTTEVRYLDEEEDWSQVNRVGRHFSAHVKGIISLHAFPYLESANLDSDRLPIVFWGRPYTPRRMICLPMVLHDTRYAFYLLTRRLIEAGHEDILLCGEGNMPPSLVEERREGHALAMEKAGLYFNVEAFQESLEIPPGNPWQLGAFLEKHTPHYTALLCISNVSVDVVSWATHKNIDIPKDLSVVGHMPEPMRKEESKPILTGIDYQLEHTVKTCFRVLNEQINSKHSFESLVYMKPALVEGDSLAPPAEKNIPDVQAI